MINYLQTITVFGISNGLQRAAAREQKTHDIQTDDNETFDIESIRSLKEIERSTPTHEDRMEKRKHTVQTPQKKGGHMQATYSRQTPHYPVTAANLSKLLSFNYFSGTVIDVFI
ncbi:MAG: hypothetical protein HQL70_06160 [Magnetococcales bacterium]|nr:hypothetical protein [Magnetococcales bacterium]